MARLQNEVGTNDFFRGTNFLTKNAPKFSPNFLSLCFVGPKKSRKIPAKFPAKFPSPKSKKNSPTSFCRGSHANVRVCAQGFEPASVGDDVSPQDTSIMAAHVSAHACTCPKSGNPTSVQPGVQLKPILRTDKTLVALKRCDL